MKTRIILLTFASLLLSKNAFAQEDKDVLWSNFRVALDEEVTRMRARERSDRILNLESLFLDTPIERKVVEYLAETFARDTIPNIRSWIGRTMKVVAHHSNDSISRQQAILFILDTSLASPRLSRLLLSDFNDNIQQQIMKIYRLEPTESIIFSVERTIRNQFMVNQSFFNRRKNELLQQYGNTKSDEEIRQQVYEITFAEEMDRVLRNRLSLSLIILTGQLNMREAIPYLKEIANDDEHRYSRYAKYALATMRVGDFEERAARDFEIDTLRWDVHFARIINSQKVWNAYLYRIKSERHYGDCPVAYLTIIALDDAVKVRMPDGVPPMPSPSFGLRDACSRTTACPRVTVPIDPDVIRFAVIWMREGKGRFELREEVIRAF